MVQNTVPKEYGRVVAYLHSVRLFDFGAATLFITRYSKILRGSIFVSYLHRETRERHAIQTPRTPTAPLVALASINFSRATNRSRRRRPESRHKMRIDGALDKEVPSGH